MKIYLNKSFNLVPLKYEANNEQKGKQTKLNSYLYILIKQCILTVANVYIYINWQTINIALIILKHVG